MFAENDSTGEYILLINSPPVIEDADLSLSQNSILENNTVALAGSYYDVNISDTHTVVIDWGDGTTSLATVDQLNHTFTASHQYADDGLTPGGAPLHNYSITATVTVDNPAAKSDSATTAITVNNVAPTINNFESDAPLSNPALLPSTVFFTGDFVDPGSLDTFTATIDWGDGSPTQAIPITPNASGGSISTSHFYADSGFYHAVLTITDDDTGQAVSHTAAAITGVGLKNGVLQIIGTDGDDSVIVKPWSGNQYKIIANFIPGSGYLLFDRDLVDTFEIYLLAGNDDASIRDSITKPALFDAGPGKDYLYAGGGISTMLGGPGNDWLVGGPANDLLDGGEGNDNLDGNEGDDDLFGGPGRDRIVGDDGNDRLFGGDDEDDLYGGRGNDILRGGNHDDNLYDYNGNNILIGDAGNDLIIGGSGRSILIGGLGLDHLISGSASDVLIGDSTVYDQHDAALLALLDEWTSTRSRSERIDNLSAGTGPLLSGTGYKLEKGTTVNDDGHADDVDGAFSDDWLFM